MSVGPAPRVPAPSAAGVESAARSLASLISESPLVRCEALSRAFSADVWLKLEVLSAIGSFKLRGAFIALLRELEQVPQLAGVVTSSTGNHGQAVAYVARSLGRSADIFLPRGANPLKRQAILAIGANVHDVGQDLDESKEFARAFAREQGHFFLDDGESLAVIEGAATVALEVTRRLPEIDWIFTPMGSGSLAGGVGTVLRQHAPKTRVVAVQAAGSPAMVLSFRAGRPISSPAQTIADGLICREPASLALATVMATVHRALLVGEDEMLQAVKAFAEGAHLLVEPSGAAGLAGALQMRGELRGLRIVLLVTGANITAELLQQALATRSPLTA